MKLYGSSLWPQCKPIMELLDKNKVEYVYLDITSNLLYLREYFKLREGNSKFDKAREIDHIGIPCLVNGEEILFEEDMRKLYK